MNPPAFWPHIKNFSPEEFQCKCGNCNHAEHMQKDTMIRLQLLRERVNQPLIITSGYRCDKHPIEASKINPGVHNTGHAADIACHGELAWLILRHAPEIGFVRIGVQQRGVHNSRFLHVDDYVGNEFVRPTVWSYP